MEQGDSLYNQIGGESAVERLVNDLYQRVQEDPKLRPFFEGHSLERIRSMQHELFCEALGGPLRYSGKPLATVHHGKGIQISHFQRFMGHVEASLKELGLSEEACAQALAALAVEADDIAGGGAEDG